VSHRLRVYARMLQAKLPEAVGRPASNFSYQRCLNLAELHFPEATALYLDNPNGAKNKAEVLLDVVAAEIIGKEPSGGLRGRPGRDPG